VAHDEDLSAVLIEFAQTMVTDFPIQAILDRLVERIVSVLPITAAGVTLISPDTAPRYVAASSTSALRFEQLQSQLGQGPCVSAFESGYAVTVANLATDDRYPTFGPAALAAGLVAVFTFPLRHGDERLGALDLYRDTPGPLDEHDMSVAQTLADVVAAYLLNAQSRHDASEASDRFRRATMHDSLTGLPNRVLLSERIEHVAARASRSHSTAAILYLDLDLFKQINDTHGHHAGDEVLVAVASRLSDLLRPGDTLARISGDEFVILCEDLTSPTDIDTLASRIDAAFGTPFIVTAGALSVTASVGIAFAGPAENVSDELVAHADAAMYVAKRHRIAGQHIIDLRDPSIGW
jgi:diguanylate cyclase (GGDEF)-like protein